MKFRGTKKLFEPAKEVISRLQRLDLVDDVFPGPLAQAVTFRAVGAFATLILARASVEFLERMIRESLLSPAAPARA